MNEQNNIAACHVPNDPSSHHPIAPEFVQMLDSIGKKYLEHVNERSWAPQEHHLKTGQILVFVACKTWKKYWVDGKPLNDLQCSQTLVESHMFPYAASRGDWTCMVVVGSDGMVISQGWPRGKHYVLLGKTLARVSSKFARGFVRLRTKAA